MLQSPFSFTPRKNRINSDSSLVLRSSNISDSSTTSCKNSHSINDINDKTTIDIPSTPEPKHTSNMLNTPPPTSRRRNSTTRKSKSSNKVTKSTTKNSKLTTPTKTKSKKQKEQDLVLPLSPPIMSSIESKLKLIQSKLLSIDDTTIKSDISNLLDSTILELNQQQSQQQQQQQQQQQELESAIDILPKLTNDQILNGTTNYILETPKNQIITPYLQTPPLAPKQEFNLCMDFNDYSQIDLNLISTQLDFDQNFY
ncbi:hypothetical protein KGF54_005527 [Candida jiufengensis]|uniref:uncharacterized protein n=1 Tax=Candida jiufengensis TaxID=497108 RepID=UPI00222428AF|nr:uncharacterized protein KGF54_005527 [Candida jiufengensis]KAI5949292.1 hypothetical protein KGF54_005527 [Candida jiufengensis]